MTPAEQSFIAKRLQQIRHWPYAAIVLLVLLLAVYGFVFLRYPLYINPNALMAELQKPQVDMLLLAELASLQNEKKLIALIPKAPVFKDHFSALAQDYAQYRPRYPESLYAALAELAPGHDKAWDCATGNGQAAEGLATHFREVYASDASAEQIAAAAGPENVHFVVAPAEASGLPDASVDLVLVAQAAHWFDLPAFYAEAERVLRPGGVLALLTYSGLRINAQLDPLLREFYEVTVGAYWPPERRHPETGYRELPFPWPEIELPPQTMEAQWNLEQLLGYLGTWSSVKAYREQNAEDPLPTLREALLPLWPEAGLARLTVSWPLPMRIGRRP